MINCPPSHTTHALSRPAASLVDLETSSESAFVSGLVTSDSWTGGVREVQTGTWTWQGGAPWTWTGWRPQPGQDCLGMMRGERTWSCLRLLDSSGGNWSSLDCTSHQSVLCEMKKSSLVQDDPGTGRSGQGTISENHFYISFNMKPDQRHWYKNYEDLSSGHLSYHCRLITERIDNTILGWEWEWSGMSHSKYFRKILWPGFNWPIVKIHKLWWCSTGNSTPRVSDWSWKYSNRDIIINFLFKIKNSF